MAMLPPNTLVGRVIIPLSPRLNPNLSNNFSPPPIPFHELSPYLSSHPPPIRLNQPFTKNVIAAQETLTAILSLKSAPILLPFMERQEAIVAIIVGHQVLCFRLSINTHMNIPHHDMIHRLFLNPQLQSFPTPASLE